MNTQRHFWHLFKFHFISPPFFMWLLLVGITVLLTPLQWMATRLGSLSDNSMLMSQIYFFIFAAQLSWGFRSERACATGQTWATGSADFLWTRAVDRPMLFWAKLAVFGVICGMVTVNIIAPQIFQTAPVQVTLWKSPSNETFKTHALATPELGAKIVAPQKKGDFEQLVLEHGRAAVVGLKSMQILLLTLFTMWCTVAFRYRKKWLFVAFGLAFAAYLAAMLLPLYFRKSDVLSWSEYREQIIFYARHAPVIWTALPALTALVVWDSRRRYLSLA